MTEAIGTYTFRLFRERPSLIGGFAALIDASDTSSRYVNCDTENEADVRSLQSDWYAIGDDLFEAITTYEREHPTREA